MGLEKKMEDNPDAGGTKRGRRSCFFSPSLAGHAFWPTGVVIAGLWAMGHKFLGAFGWERGPVLLGLPHAILGGRDTKKKDGPDAIRPTALQG